ncbi:MAG: tetraacyldisaccharide 4'-kinase [Marinilabiliaceae bacterium]|nr:tetraacyldisaccharide 4'-kinase [Marinilabiliaceae bacterium]
MGKSKVSYYQEVSRLLHLVRWLLFPISLIYGIVVRLRNLFFDWGWISSRSFDVPVISLGNITVGGTGKTPHAEYLVRLLQPWYRLTLISRGYRRKTKGVVMATQQSTAHDIGDEPKQMLHKFPGLGVVVAEKRVAGIEWALQQIPSPQVIVMDDAYQHRHVKPGFSVVLMDISRPLWHDAVLPAGDLREPMSGLKRANIIIVTKCLPNLSMDRAQSIVKRLKPAEHQKVFFSAFQYGNPYALFPGAVPFGGGASVLVLTGIARPMPLYQHLNQLGYRVIPCSFGDHHDFSHRDLASVESRFLQLPDGERTIVTTEKDAIRLKEMTELSPLLQRSLWVIPIEPYILFGEQEMFNSQILEYVRKNQSHV